MLHFFFQDGCASLATDNIHIRVYQGNDIDISVKYIYLYFPE